ncbi:hypothetical protein [Leclercia sp.]|uniref:hypothetical protein n=1 Tax=Leclercia sp. TaxID=1898428 RepID=UPI00289B2DDC|nr:hypothetical protein [Leclercia sp.]
MKNPNQCPSFCTLSNAGEDRLLKVAQASKFLADTLSACGSDGNKDISSDGAAAVFACLAELLDGVVSETSTMQGGHHGN